MLLWGVRSDLGRRSGWFGLRLLVSPRLVLGVRLFGGRVVSGVLSRLFVRLLLRRSGRCRFSGARLIFRLRLVLFGCAWMCRFGVRDRLVSMRATGLWILIV